MERTLPREKFLTLMAEWGHASSADMVSDVLDDMGWGEKAEFTKSDVLTVIEKVTEHGQNLIVDAPQATAGMSDEDKLHLAAMLDTVSDHALPVLRNEAEKSG